MKSGKKHISEIAQLSTIDTSNLSSSLFHDAQEAFLLNPMSSALFLLPFSSQTIEFVSSVYLKGYLEYRRGNYLKVLSTCSMVEAPIHSFVNSLLGSSEFALGHADKALYHYSCIKGGSLFQQGQTHKILGLIYISKKQYQYAIYHLSEAARLLPNHPSIWFYYSLSLMGTSKHDRYGCTLFTLQKCLDVSKSCDIEWKYWVHLLRVSIFDELCQPVNILKEIELIEELVGDNSSFSRNTLESKQYLAIVKAESYLQLGKCKVVIITFLFCRKQSKQ